MTVTLALKRQYRKVLFDMDGTLVDSRAVVERTWHAWAVQNRFDATAILRVSHGRRAIDTIREFASDRMDIDAEAAMLAHNELSDVEGVVAVSGALELLTRLNACDWAVVTSASRELACRRLLAAGLPVPDVLIAAEDVKTGKPDPECYKLAARRLGTVADQCLVFEDAPAGIAAGMAAGSDVVAIKAAQPHEFDTKCPTIEDFNAISFRLGSSTSA